jgi:hypothetical protein
MSRSSREDGPYTVRSLSPLADPPGSNLPDVGEPRAAADAMVTIPKTLGEQSDVGTVRRELDDDHVHMVLVVDDQQRLLTTITRSDLPLSVPNSMRAIEVGQLVGRTTRPTTPIIDITAWLDRTGERRLAVTDDRGRLLGLLCLKRNRTGYCSDEGVAARACESRTVASVSRDG